jgi:hypothetical protein
MRPSPATVIACAALLVSLSGNAAAFSGLITGKNIKNGTIQLADLSPSARKALQGQRGPRGVEGPRGRTGPAGGTGSSSVLARRVTALESFRLNLCLDGVLSNVTLNTATAGYSLSMSRNDACI